MTNWIDLTDLMSWRGHLTGIQRVVFSIASRMQRDDAEGTKFFYFDPHDNNFYVHEIDLTTWLEDNKAAVSTTQLSIRERAVGLVPHRIKMITPKPVKQFVIRSAKYTLRKRQALKAKLKPRKKDNNRVVAQFKQKDIVMVLGNAWDKPAVMKELGLLKSQKQFRLINVVYDLIPIFEPQFFGGLVTQQYTEYLFEAVVNCDVLLPISKSTDRDIARFCKEYDMPTPVTKVIRLGDEIENTEDKRPNWVNDTDFALCVGTIEIRKNHTLLYYAYKKLLLDGVKPPKLLIVGKRGWYTGDTCMLFEQDPLVRQYVRIVENATDAELAWLYQNCQFTIYPSLYEGWGLPVAESLARGKVVLASNQSSVPEAGGDLAEYFSPYDPIACAELIKKYSNTTTLEHAEQAIIKRYKITTWEECYKQYFSYMKKAGYIE